MTVPTSGDQQGAGRSAGAVEPQPALAGPPAKVSRVAFLGTPIESVVALRALAGAGFEIPVVVTQPDRRRGRGGKLLPSPVKEAANELGLDVANDLAGLVPGEIDLGVVVAYGRIIPVSVLTELAMVNIHFSLLPRWRGAAPVERAILAGDTRTGVCLMEVAAGLDEGGVYAKVEVDIDPDESALELRARLAGLGATLLVEQLERGLAEPVAQVGEVTYASKIEASEFRLDFERSAIEVNRVIRLGRAWAEFRGQRLVVLAARVVSGSGPPGALSAVPASSGGRGRVPVVATVDGSLELIEVKPEGRRAQPATDWLNGVKLGSGDRLE